MAETAEERVPGAPTAKAFRRVIDLKDGSGVQVFEADTAEELLDLLAEAQVNATKKIAEQDTELKATRRAAVTPDPEEVVTGLKPRELTADQKFEIGQRLANPATAVEATRELIEAELGAPLPEVRKRLDETGAGTREQRTQREAYLFANSTPDWYPTEENKKKLIAHMVEKKMAMTQKNFGIAFEDLSAAGLLQMRDSEEGHEETDATREPARRQAAADSAPVDSRVRVTPRSASSTSIASRGSGAPRGGSTVKMPTADEVDAMPLAEYDKRMKDPAFKKHVDNLPRRR
jgi:hypothetical protein